MDGRVLGWRGGRCGFALIGPSAPLRGGIAQYHDRLAAALATSRTRRAAAVVSPHVSAAAFSGPHAVRARSAAGRSVSAPRLPISRPPASAARLDRTAQLVGGGASRGARPRRRSSSGGIRSSRRRSATIADGAAAPAACRPSSSATISSRTSRCRRGRWLAALRARTRRGIRRAERGRCGASARALSRAAGARSCCRPPSRRRRVAHGGRSRVPARARSDCRRRRVGCSSSGTCASTKGCPTLLEAMAAVAGRRPAGRGGRDLSSRCGPLSRGSPRAPASPTASCCSIASSRRRRGRLLLRASDLVVLPYWEASQSAVVPLAMACGRGVVATAVGGLPDLVRDERDRLPGAAPRRAARSRPPWSRGLDGAPRLGRAARVRARTRPGLARRGGDRSRILRPPLYAAARPRVR